MSQNQMETNDWFRQLEYRNAYYQGLFAARKIKAQGKALVIPPNTNSREEGVFLHMGVQDGLSQSGSK